MSTYYMIDLFDDNINGVETPPNGQVPMVGTYVVRVPQGVSVQNPTTLATLLTQKYDAIFANHGGFANQEFDDLLDATGINAGATSGCSLGKRGSLSLFPNGVLQTNMTPLATTATQAIVNFEVFEVVDTDPATGRFDRTYKEIPITPLDITCQVSFDNGASFLTVTEDSLLSVPGANQGNQMILKFTNITSPGRRLFLGGWSVVY